LHKPEKVCISAPHDYYQPDETIRLEVRVEDETVWLSQAQDILCHNSHEQCCLERTALDAKKRKPLTSVSLFSSFGNRSMTCPLDSFKDTANFLKNKKLPGFSWNKFVDSDFLVIFAASLLTH